MKTSRDLDHTHLGTDCHHETSTSGANRCTKFDVNLPHLYLAPPLGWRRRNFTDIFGIGKLESAGYRMALLLWS